ncbi:phenazine antibiotic biosynthesis protein [Nocardia sp. NPDC006044]|uniref:phenazine antibiotic biosynthesis protein n=1 Tax=Nocardia sp. NPDC006044 TaxID=3364306 RepID=UPI00367C3A86
MTYVYEQSSRGGFGRAMPSGEFIESVMHWHFSPTTGSPFWLRKAKEFDFDPLADVRTPQDLKLFPDIADELRNVPVGDLVPRGYGADPEIYAVYDSGGTTGAPKRLVFMADWMNLLMEWSSRDLDTRGYRHGSNWLALVPSGPHLFGDFTAEMVRRRGGFRFTIDMDPRWVKECVRIGDKVAAARYMSHLVAQTEDVLRTQDIAVMVVTPPLLEQISRNSELVELINRKIELIIWGGAHMGSDTRRVFRTELFPDISFYGYYGSVTMLGTSVERAGLAADDPCVFDTFSPYIFLSVVDPDTRTEVAYGERGRVIMNHVSKSMLLPNNLERDLAVRVRAPEGGIGDSVADIRPISALSGNPVIEGVY